MSDGPQHRASARVLVLGEESRVVLPVIRSLGRIGVRVDLGWCPSHEPARWSRYVDTLADLPMPDDPTAITALVAHATGVHDVIIPATESATWALHTTRSNWDGLPVAIGPERALTVAFDKAATHALARSLDVPVPAAVDVGASEPGGERDERENPDVARIVAEAGLTAPFVVKPGRSIDPEGLTKVAVRIVADAASLDGVVAELTAAAGAVQIQEYVTGSGVGVEVLASDGEVLYAFQHRRLHESTGYGSTYRESVALDPELLDATTALVRALDYTGVAMFEFRVDGIGAAATARRWVLLEINPRFWGSLPLSVAAGADFPADLYELVRFGRRRFHDAPGDTQGHDESHDEGHYEIGVRSRDLLNDLRWMWRQRPGVRGGSDAIEAGRDGWGVNVVDRRTLAGDAGRLLTFRDHVDLYDRGDPMPAVHELRRVGEMVARVAARSTARVVRRSPGRT